MAHDSTSLTRCSPRRGKELATLSHNTMAQDGTSLTRCSPKRGRELATLPHNTMAQGGTSLTKMSRDHLWRSIARNTNVEGSALFRCPSKNVFTSNVNIFLPLLFLLRLLFCASLFRVNEPFSSCPSPSPSLKCALRESACRIGYEPTKMSRDHFWRSISRDTNVEVSAVSPLRYIKQC